MECSYCLQNTAKYEEQGTDKLKFCSYACQSIAKTVNDDDHLSLYMNAVKLDAAEKITTFGPGSEVPYNVPLPLRSFMLRCTKYFSRLSLFDQYIVWRYTIGSRSVNTVLITGKLGNLTNSVYWVTLFFLYWKNTNAANGFPNNKTDPSFSTYERFFKDPYAFANRGNQSVIDALDVIKLYSEALQRIILATPPVKEGFHLYKVSSAYPGLPQSTKELPKRVPQAPFNSTTIKAHMNFAPFISKDASGYLFDLRISRGARILYVPTDFHAYPFEKEVLLPFGSEFVVTSAYKGILDVIDQESVISEKLQEPEESIVMGPVYEINEYKPCRSGECKIEKREFTIFVADYREK